jgi:uncharacterized protein (TIGR01777 family)
VAVHGDFRLGESFSDTQESGPFAHWHHHHAVFPRLAACGSELTDHITWELPWFARPLSYFVARDVARQFAWRHARMGHDVVRHAAARKHLAEIGREPVMTVAVSGTSGLVGGALVPFLTTGGHRVRRLVRHGATGPDAVVWDAQAPDPAVFSGCDAVVHLAGAGIAERRWTPERQAEIRASRVEATRSLCMTLARLRQPPRVLVCASAVGFYGTADATPADERTPAGEGFLAETCRDWEAACEPARLAGIRVMNLRFGVVLAAKGGALARMLPVFRAGLGGRLGDGTQAMPWIGLDDALGVILQALCDHRLAGEVNAVAPDMVSNADFTRTLGRVLHRPVVLPIPPFAIRALLGAMGEALLLRGRAVVPRRLTDVGFTWLTPTLDAALRWELGLAEK